MKYFIYMISNFVGDIFRDFLKVIIMNKLSAKNSDIRIDYEVYK